MNFLDAIKSGKPIRLKGHTFSYISPLGLGDRCYIISDAWIDPIFFLEYIRLTREDIICEFWETKPDDEYQTHGQGD